MAMLPLKINHQATLCPLSAYDHQRPLAPVAFTFRGELHDFQVEAVDAMAYRHFGVLAAPTGSGKTVMALALVAMRRMVRE